MVHWELGVLAVALTVLVVIAVLSGVWMKPGKAGHRDPVDVVVVESPPATVSPPGELIKPRLTPI